MDQYKLLLENFFTMEDDTEDKYKELIKDKNYTLDIPKQTLYVKMNSSISSNRR